MKPIWLSALLNKLTDFAPDPARNCGIHLEMGCSHVDGPLCDFPKCSILEIWRRGKLYEELGLEEHENGPGWEEVPLLLAPEEGNPPQVDEVRPPEVLLSDGKEP